RGRQIVGVAAQHGDDARAPVALAAARDTGKDLPQQFTLVRVDRVGPAGAPRVARFMRRGIAEVAKNGRPQAPLRLRVLDHPLQLAMLEVLAAPGFLWIHRGTSAGLVAARAVDEELTRRDVAVVPQQRRRRRTAVTAGAPDLLVIGLHRTGD